MRLGKWSRGYPCKARSIGTLVLVGRPYTFTHMCLTRSERTCAAPFAWVRLAGGLGPVACRPRRVRSSFCHPVVHPISRPLFDLSFQTPHSGICRGPCVGGQFQCPAQLESRFVRRCDRGIRSAGLQVQTARTDGPSAWLSIHPSWSTSHGHDFCGWRLTSRQPSAVQLKCSIALAAMEVSVYQCISTSSSSPWPVQ